MAQAVTTEAHNGSSGFRFTRFLSKFTDNNLHWHVEVPRTLVLYDFKSCSGSKERRNRKKLEKHGKADSHDSAQCAPTPFTNCY